MDAETIGPIERGPNAEYFEASPSTTAGVVIRDLRKVSLTQQVTFSYLMRFFTFIKNIHLSIKIMEVDLIIHFVHLRADKYVIF